MPSTKKIDTWTEEDWRNQHSTLDMAGEWTRFNHCQAWYQYLGGWLWIKSYSTLVAGICGRDIHRRGYYSRTTSKQLTQIYNAIQRGLI
jgi:hypothetical protein